MDLQAALIELRWRDVPRRAIALAEKCADVTTKARAAVAMEDQDGFLDLWYSADKDKLLLNVGDWIAGDTLARWKQALEPLAASLEVADEAGGPGPGDWVKIAERPLAARVFLEKRSVSPTLSALATAGGYKPSPLTAPFGGPNPLVSMLASGLLGTGAGYGLGFAAEQLLPDQWERGKLRRTGAMLGGAAGAALPAAWMAANVYNGESPFKGHPQHPVPFAKAGSQSAYDGPLPTINVPGFTSTLWDDPRVSQRVPAQTRAAATGLVAGASALRDGADFVSPLDIARITAGMGVGYLSGGLVGKVLGVLTGLPDAAQEQLKTTGMYAGILNAVIPHAF